MDDDLQELEAELKALRPAAPPATLLARIESDLRESIRPRPSPTWWWAAALPAAAALAVMSASIARRDFPRANRGNEVVVSGSDAGVLKPVAAENVLYSVRDEGVVTLD